MQSDSDVLSAADELERSKTKNTRQISHAETTEQEQNELLKRAWHPLSCIISGSSKYLPVSKSDNTVLYILQYRNAKTWHDC